MTTTKQQTNENLRVLILPQADIQRLQALLAQEINFNTEFMQAAPADYFHYKNSGKEQDARSVRNFISTRKKKLNNLANLQYKLKHQTLNRINAALILSSTIDDYGSKFYD